MSDSRLSCHASVTWTNDFIMSDSGVNCHVSVTGEQMTDILWKSLAVSLALNDLGNLLGNSYTFPNLTYFSYKIFTINLHEQDTNIIII